MQAHVEDIQHQVARLQRSVRRQRCALGALAVVAAALLAMGSGDPVPDEVRAHRFVMVDEDGVPRVILQQDPIGAGRRSRSAGLVVLDGHGHERGGFATMDDGSVVLGLDAPRGVGAAMPDRIGLRVDADGAASIMVIDNETRGVARMDSDAAGKGGLKVFKWDTENRQVHVKTLAFDGESIETIPVEGG